jgi:hypothetical protein
MVPEFNSLLLLRGDVMQQTPKIQRDNLSTNPTKLPYGRVGGHVELTAEDCKWPILGGIYIEALVLMIATHKMSERVLSTGR